MLKKGVWDSHNCPQAWFLNGNGKLRNVKLRRIEKIDIFLKFENLNVEIQNKISKDIKLTFENVMKKNRKKI